MLLLGTLYLPQYHRGESEYLLEKTRHYSNPDTDPDSNWQDYAACLEAGIDPELFFPERMIDRGVESQQVKDAKKICGQCAVQSACLMYALESGEQFGIWGGKTPNERADIIRRKNRERRRSRYL